MRGNDPRLTVLLVAFERYKSEIKKIPSVTFLDMFLSTKSCKSKPKNDVMTS